VDIGGTEQTTETVDWLYWGGMWGDEQYPTSDKRQSCALGVSYILIFGGRSLTSNRLTICATTNLALLVPLPRISDAQLFVRKKTDARSRPNSEKCQQHA
jgi:hypothetical protein